MRDFYLALAAIPFATAACASDPTPAAATTDAGCFFALPNVGTLDSDLHAVNGNVLSAEGLPLDGALVEVDGQIDITDPSGGFSFVNVGARAGGGLPVTVPYDIVIRDGLLVSAFVGLSRQHVTLKTSGHRPLHAWSTHVTTLLPQVAKIAFLAEGPYVTAIETTGDGIIVHWVGTYSQTVVLHAIGYDIDTRTKLPVGFGQAVVPMSLVADQPSVWSGTFAPVDSQSLTLTTHVPPAYGAVSLDAVIDVGGATGASLGPFPGFPSSVLLPKLPAGNVRVSALARHGEEIATFAMKPVALTSLSLLGGAPLALDFFAAPALVAPADGASGSLFTWTATPGGTSQVFVTPEDSRAPGFVITTSDSKASIPDLTAFKLLMPTGARYHWTVRESVDETGGVDQITCGIDENEATRSATSVSRLWLSP